MNLRILSIGLFRTQTLDLLGELLNLCIDIHDDKELGLFSKALPTIARQKSAIIKYPRRMADDAQQTEECLSFNTNRLNTHRQYTIWKKRIRANGQGIWREVHGI